MEYSISKYENDKKIEKINSYIIKLMDLFDFHLQMVCDQRQAFYFHD